jgi:electron transfer flavoprotein beta subunit
MRTIVCMKVVPKTEEVMFDKTTKAVDLSQAEYELNESDKNALEVALQLKKKHGGDVIILSEGPLSFEPHLRTGIAIGADDVILLSDSAFEGGDAYSTSYILGAAIRKIGDYDLILCGEESSDTPTGQVPPGIAEWLGIPQVSSITQLDIISNIARAKRTITGGYEVVETPLPVVASVELGCNSPRFPGFRRQKLTEFKLTVWTAHDLDVDHNKIGGYGSHTVVENLEELPKPSRKMERIGGSPREEATQILEKMRQALAG